MEQAILASRLGQSVDRNASFPCKEHVRNAKSGRRSARRVRADGVNFQSDCERQPAGMLFPCICLEVAPAGCESLTVRQSH